MSRFITPPVSRSPRGGEFSGTSRALGEIFGVSGLLVRTCIAILATAKGLGIGLYILAWALIPKRKGEEEGGDHLTSFRHSLGMVLVTAGIMVIARYLGLWFTDGTTAVVSLIAIGFMVVWERADDAERAGIDAVVGTLMGGKVPDLYKLGWIRLFVGAIFMTGGIGVMVVTTRGVSTGDMADIAIAITLTMVGVATVALPLIQQANRKTEEAVRDRVRAEERADMAAHLHDSVLQTLALIQRTQDPNRIHQLARQQERALRTWLFSDQTQEQVAKTVREAMEMAATHIEGIWPVKVELVVVGDRDLTPALEQVIAATSEAVVNAAKHAQVDKIDVFADVKADTISVWVRDEGVGFDPGTIDESRQGVRNSIIGRLDRLGGQVQIYSEPGEGTEIEITCPLDEGTD